MSVTPASSTAPDGRATLRRWPWPLVLLAMAYVVVSTLDVKFGPFPLKFVLTVAALAAWAAARRAAFLRLARTRPGLGVLSIGVLLPAVWFVVAVVRVQLDDPAQLHGLRDAFEVGSRFVYVLFAFPLMDLLASGSLRTRIGVPAGAALILAAATLGLTAAHLAGVVLDYEQVGPFQGAFGVEPATGTFRAFFVNQVLFIPAFCVLLAILMRRGASALILALLALVLASLYVSHSRGIWTGMTVGAVVMLAIGSPYGRLLDRPWVRGVGVLGVLASIVMLSAPHLFSDLASAVTGGKDELSASTRLDQGPELVRGFDDHPVIGSGLAAYLPSGFRRSEPTPWSFEQTYLQLLFQLGVVGLGLFFASLLPALWAGWRAVFAAPRTTAAPYALAGIGSLAGLVFAYASNPYLLTSPGMLALAAALALLVTRPERGAATSPDARSRAGSAALPH